MTKAKDTAVDQAALNIGSFDADNGSADAYVEHVLKCVTNTEPNCYQDLGESVDTPFRAGAGIHCVGAYKFY